MAAAYSQSLALQQTATFLGVFEPGSHGSTFGGNPLACAVSIAALEVLEEEKLTERSLQLGEKLVGQLKEIDNPMITEVRGKGLFIGIELKRASSSLL